jgi:hypothetical protein
MSHRDERLVHFLERFQISSPQHKYLIGVFEAGVTVRRQQVRALNLVYALESRKTLKAGSSVACIGAGFAGLTCAVAALERGAKVTLIESAPQPLHLQDGCDHRWLHPHIYDWPQPGSTEDNALLPLLNWTAGTAASVADEVLRQWHAIQQKYTEKDEGLRVFYETQAQVVDGKMLVSWTDHKRGLRMREPFEIIIFAVGFGVETGVGSHPANSYWRNDALHQTGWGGARVDQRVLVSGVGDGGLIDLQRLGLKRFRQDRILKELFDGPEAKACLGFLRSLDQDFGHHPPQTRNKELIDRLAKLDDATAEMSAESAQQRRALTSVDDLLLLRRRRDRTVFLCAEQPTIEEALRKSNAALLNVFVAYRMWKKVMFDYIPGRLESVKTTAHQNLCTFSTSERREEQFDAIVLRHGTDRDAMLSRAGCGDTNGRKKASNEFSSGGFWKPLWPSEWCANCRKQPVPARLAQAAEKLVSHLSILLSGQAHMDEATFRATLHRVAYYDEETCLQQITNYQGTNGEAKIGRWFTLSTGIIGRSARYGKIFSLKKSACSDEEFEQTLRELGVKTGGYSPEESSKPRRPKATAFLAVPILLPSTGSAERVALVFYSDSDKDDFLDEERLHGFFGKFDAALTRAMPELSIVTECYAAAFREPDLGAVPTLKGIDQLNHPVPRLKDARDDS